MAMRFLFMFALSLIASSRVHAQSVDDVHIVPRNGTTAGVKVQTPEMVPADASGSLFARTKPFRVNVDLVLVPVTVTDAKQRPVMGLEKQDFALYEDEKQQEIRYFSTEPGPISVAILLDVSRSMTDKLEAERTAVREFFQNADPKDEYFAITFSNRPRLIASATQSIDEIDEKLTGIEPGSTTAMLDAIYLAESQLRSARYKRRAILLITDGGDNASRYTMREIKNFVQESDVQIYAIGLFETFLFNTFEERMGKKWLSGITDRTGGRTVTVDSRLKLPGAAAQLSREMRNDYVLGYRKTEGAPNHWRKIRVDIKSSSIARDVRASYKKGYITAE